MSSSIIMKMKSLVLCLSIITQMKCKRVEFTSTSQMELLNEHGIDIASRNSLVFDLKTCSDNVFMMLTNTLDLKTNPNASYYTVVFSDAINMISVNCLGCAPVMYYPLTTVGPCNTTHELWVAWDPDGPLRIGQGHVVEERTFMNLKEGNVTDIFYAQISATKPVNFTFIVEDDAVEFLIPSPDGSTFIELSEDISPGTTILNITTTRADFVIKADVFGNLSSRYFYMDGMALKINQPLDFESHQLHNVRLITSESVSLSVKVIVTDVNDETPQVTCDEAVQLAEECPVGIGIAFPCVITDADHGDTYNISIEGPDSDYFRVDNDTQIIMARHLDRDGEQGRQSLNISLVVQDQAGHINDHALPLQVKDVNDNYPMFSSSVYIINVTENNTHDTSVLNLTVSDEDQDSNSNITVTIYDRDANDCRFHLDNLTLILEAGHCDFEEFEIRDQTYTLTLKAQDKPIATPVKTGVAIVVIQVQPRNEHIPFWNTSRSNVDSENVTSKSALEKSSSESTSSSTERRSSAETQAYDTTVDDNNTIATDSSSKEKTNASITSGPSINDIKSESTSTTDATTAGSATYSVSQTTKALRKRNVRSIQMKGIMVADENKTYTFPTQTVSETANIGTHVYTLMAGDDDSDQHSQLEYNITQCLSDKGEDSLDVFEINPITGDIVTAAPLDRDDPSNGSACYTLVVTCSDGEFTINGTLLIDVKEENEFPPSFARSAHSVDFSFAEDEPRMITNFSVSDLDLNSDITLSFLNETPGFYLKRTNISWGLYYNNSQNDSSGERLPRNLVVIATDKGLPVLTSSTIVIFKRAICALPSTTAVPTTATAIRTSETTITTSHPSTKAPTTSTTRPRCVTQRDAHRGSRLEKEETEILFLTIMAVVEGVIMVALLVVTWLVFTGRLFGDKNSKKDKHPESDDIVDSTDNMSMSKLSEHSINHPDHSQEVLSLRELGEDLDRKEGKELEETKLTGGGGDDILKTTEDSGRGSCPSMVDGDIGDSVEDVGDGSRQME